MATISFILLIATAIFATVGSTSEKIESLPTKPVSVDILETATHATNNQNAGQPEEVHSIFEQNTQTKKFDGDAEEEENQDDKEDSNEDEEDKNDENDEDDDGDEDDEYEDELKAIAESHEAMSRDETKSSNVTTASARNTGLSSGTNYESQEKSVEEGSEENMTSNEAIAADTTSNEGDEEVAQLLHYKESKAHVKPLTNEEKKKRVPTVKKELSSQKEILAANNDTQVKTLVPSEQVYNFLNEETDIIQRRNIGNNEPNKGIGEEENKHENLVEGEIYLNDEDIPIEYPKVLDKRQERELANLKAYLLAYAYATEHEQQHKLPEILGRIIKDDALAEYLLKLPDKFQSDSITERMNDLLKSEVDLAKRIKDNLVLNTASSSTSSPPDLPKKSTKKPKKKKKKPLNRTTTVVPPISKSVKTPSTSTIFMVTAEPTWMTKPVQWRLIAERLFGTSRQKNLHNKTGAKLNDSRNTANVRQPALMKSRDMSSPINQITDNSKDNWADSQQNSLHQNKFPFIVEQDEPNIAVRIQNFNRQEKPFYHSIYNPFGLQSRNFQQRGSPNDYRDNFAQPDNHFAENHDYESRNLNYASSRTWQDIPLSYNRAWKINERVPVNDWPVWPNRSKFWQSERSYWARPDTQGRELETPWLPRQHQERFQSGWNHIGTRPSNDFYKNKLSNIWDNNNKNQIFLNKLAKLPENDKFSSKVSVSNWNNLNSDMTTWPIKLTNSESWSNNENGKSYNQDVNLMRKFDIENQNERKFPLENEYSKPADLMQIEKPKYKLSDKTMYKKPIEQQTNNFAVSKQDDYHILKPIDYYPQEAIDFDNSKTINYGTPKLHSQAEKPSKVSGTWSRMLPTIRKWVKSGDFEKFPLKDAIATDDNLNTDSESLNKNQSVKSTDEIDLEKIKAFDSWITSGDKNPINPQWNEDNLKSVQRIHPIKNNEEKIWNMKNENSWKQKFGHKWSTDSSAVMNNAKPWSPAKWKQFMYHKVTAPPYFKQNNSPVSKPKNVVAVSAVSSPESNKEDWRKQVIEQNILPDYVGQKSLINNKASEKSEDRIRAMLQPSYPVWKKMNVNGHLGVNFQNKNVDLIETQLETLKRENSSLDEKNYSNLEVNHSA